MTRDEKYKWASRLFSQANEKQFVALSKGDMVTFCTYNKILLNMIGFRLKLIENRADAV